MAKQATLLVWIVLAAFYIGGCRKSTPLPLNESECKQMKDKQLEMMVAELPKEYQAGFADGSFKPELDCDSLGEQGRVQYECTMSANAMKDVEQCFTKNAGR